MRVRFFLATLVAASLALSSVHAEGAEPKSKTTTGKRTIKKKCGLTLSRVTSSVVQALQRFVPSWSAIRTLFGAAKAAAYRILGLRLPDKPGTIRVSGMHACSSSKKSQIAAAKTKAIKWLKAAISKAESRAARDLVLKIFGSAVDTKATLEKMLAMLESRAEIVCHDSSKETDEMRKKGCADRNAMVVSNSLDANRTWVIAEEILYLCPLYFGKSGDEKVLSLIHESSHLIGKVPTSEAESYCMFFMCDGSCSGDFTEAVRTADNWAQFVGCINGYRDAGEVFTP